MKVELLYTSLHFYSMEVSIIAAWSIFLLLFFEFVSGGLGYYGLERGGRYACLHNTLEESDFVIKKLSLFMCVIKY